MNETDFNQEMITEASFARLALLLGKDIEASKIALAAPVVANNMLKLLNLIEIQEARLSALERHKHG